MMNIYRGSWRAKGDHNIERCNSILAIGRQTSCNALPKHVAQDLIRQHTAGPWRQWLAIDWVHPRAGRQPLLQGISLRALAPAAEQLDPA